VARQGSTDTDLGLADIFREVEKLKSMCVKVGIPENKGSKEGEDGVTIAQYATYNELGVKRKDETEWFIPPRPFVRGWADGKREQTAKMMEKLGNLVTSGKLKAKTAIRRLGEYGMDGVKDYIEQGSFVPNSDITLHGSKPDKNGKQFIKPKKSTKPLINNGTMRDSIGFQPIEKPVALVSEK
jgi:hypothetical protein